MFLSKSLLLMINEVFSKSFSFLLFFILGIYLEKESFSEFILEMPFIFIFSTVLSFGCTTYFLNENRINKELKSSNFKEPITLVFFLNLLLMVIGLVLYSLGVILFRHLIILFATISLNLNVIITESFFILKKTNFMVLTNTLPKLSIILIIFGLLFFNQLTLDRLYYGFIIVNLIFSVHILAYLNLRIKISFIKKYFNYTWVLCLQALLVYLTYTSYRYFINTDNGSSYLIEFGVMQTYLGFFALLVSVSNRLIIHDLYDSLKKNGNNSLIRIKMDFFIRMFAIISIVYLLIVVFYLDRINLPVNSGLIVEVFIMIIGSLVYFISQFIMTIIVYNNKFKLILIINIISSILSILLSYLSMKLNINILFPISLLIVNSVTLLFCIYNNPDIRLLGYLLPKKSILKLILFLIISIGLNFVFYANMYVLLSINLIFIIGVLIEAGRYFLKVKRFFI